MRHSSCHFVIRWWLSPLALCDVCTMGPGCLSGVGRGRQQRAAGCRSPRAVLVVPLVLQPSHAVARGEQERAAPDGGGHRPLLSCVRS